MTLYNAASLPPAGANTLDACTAVVQEEEEEEEQEVQGEEEGANNTLELRQQRNPWTSKNTKINI